MERNGVEVEVEITLVSLFLKPKSSLCASTFSLVVPVFFSSSVLKNAALLFAVKRLML